MDKDELQKIVNAIELHPSSQPHLEELCERVEGMFMYSPVVAIYDGVIQDGEETIELIQMGEARFNYVMGHDVNLDHAWLEVAFGSTPEGVNSTLWTQGAKFEFGIGDHGNTLYIRNDDKQGIPNQPTHRVYTVRPMELIGPSELEELE